MALNLSANVLDTIGKTPLVALDRLTAGLPGRIFAKLEYLTAGMSIKDRMALETIEQAERNGQLKPGQPVIELTSGNAGTGLAIVCAVKGYRFIAVMSEGNSIERARMMSALGAEVVLVPQVTGVPGQVSGKDLEAVDQATTALVKKLNAFRVDQFHNVNNKAVHEKYTAAEIWEQTGGNFNYFTAIPGSGGSFAGISGFIKEHNPAIRCILLEPASAPYLSAGKVMDPNHKIQGVGYAMDLPLIDLNQVDGFLSITDGEAAQAARRLAKCEGIFAGFSSGANIAGALKLAKQANPGGNIVTTVNDSGLKYLSTDLWEDFSPAIF
ncbi:MAG: cysteine synthase family protein [Chloroflexi bacterium]|nr:cysteine synthase family protein [Chloroflexota bacterium]